MAIGPREWQDGTAYVSVKPDRRGYTVGVMATDLTGQLMLLDEFDGSHTEAVVTARRLAKMYRAVEIVHLKRNGDTSSIEHL